MKAPEPGQPIHVIQVEAVTFGQMPDVGRVCQLHGTDRSVSTFLYDPEDDSFHPFDIDGQNIVSGTSMKLDDAIELAKRLITDPAHENILGFDPNLN